MLLLYLTDLPKETQETQLLTATIKKAEKSHSLFKIRFSTVLCIGLPGAGKTSFCNLLMNKSNQVTTPGNTCTIYIKRPTPNASHEEPEWTEINAKELVEIIDQLNSYKENSLCNKREGIINPDEKWDVLFLLDGNIPSSALSLLPPSLVTFVTYKMLGRDFSFTDPCIFIKSGNFPKFVKELLSCSCVRRNSKFHELEISDECGISYTVFVATYTDSSSQQSYENELGVVNGALHNVKSHINCSYGEFPLSFWYLDKKTYLHQVNLSDQKGLSIEKIRKRLDSVIAKNSAYKIPITWILFYFKLYQLCLTNKFAYYNTVFELWKTECSNYSENEFKLALNFFHHLGMLFYFDTVKGLENYVFTDCLWLFEKLNYLLSDFEDNKLDYDAREALKHTGLLQSKMIKQIEFEGPGKMKLQAFINLLTHLKYMAPLNQHDYFMPSILEFYKSNTDILKSYGEPHPQPLLVTFSSGSLHRNFFCFLAAYIIETKKWQELNIKKQQHTFKDLIIFSIDVEKYVSIIDKIFFLEIKLFNTLNETWHNSAFKFIEHAVNVVCNELQLSIEDCKYGFLCHNCEDSFGDHMMVVEDFKDKHACCCKINKSKRLSADHTVWFLEVCYPCVMCSTFKHDFYI